MAQVDEALRQGWEYLGSDGRHICEAPLMSRLEAKCFVKVERVGGSVFASITDAGRSVIAL
jgi:hypothetical protein